jgi:hypothetical protein
MSRERWRLLPFNNEVSGRQLALSETLTGGLETSSLYWYEAAQPALILGAAQQPAILDLEISRRPGTRSTKGPAAGR